MTNNFIVTYKRIITEEKMGSTFLVGSIVLNGYLNRKIGDLDFSFYNGKEAKKFLRSFRDRILISYHKPYKRGVDIYKNRYYILGYTDANLFKSNFVVRHNGVLKVLPEIELAFKTVKNREKDVEDIKYIKSRYENEFDWNLIDELVNKKNDKKFHFFLLFIQKIIQKSLRVIDRIRRFL